MNKNTTGLVIILAVVIAMMLVEFKAFQAKREAAYLFMGVVAGAITQWCWNLSAPKDDQ